MTKLRQLKIAEVSLVDRPANPGAKVVLAKREAVTKGIDMACPDCEADLPTMWGNGGPEIPNYCPECGAGLSLTTVKKLDRSGMSDSDFAAVWTDADGNKQRKLPINDAAHIRNALARFDQTQLPADVKTKAKAKLDAAARKAGIGEPAKKNDKESQMENLTPESLAKLDPEVKKAVEKLQADLKAATDKVTELSKKADDKEDVLKGLSPAAREIVEKAQRDSAAATERVAKLEDEAQTRVFIEKAAALPMLAKSSKDLGGLLKAANRKLEKGEYEALEALLKAANDQIAKGELFGEFGTGGGAAAGAGDSAYAQARSKAQEMVAKGEAKTVEQAVTIVFKREPKLYAQHVEEQRGRN